MDFILSLTIKTIGQVWLTFQHNWPYLVLSVVLAVLLKVYLDPRRVSEFLLRHQKAGVIGATAVAVGTPLCSCGTTAIVLGMIANYMPWAPIVAFMVASPLTSPEELVYSAGLFGWRFAIAFFAASILLGLAGGMVAGIADSRGWLVNQVHQALAPEEPAGANSQPVILLPEAAASIRNSSFVPVSALALQPACCALETGFAPRALPGEAIGCACEPNGAAAPMALPVFQSTPACGCGQPSEPTPAGDSGCACSLNPAEQTRPVTFRMILKEMFVTGKRLLAMFLGFAFIGYFLNSLIPASWVAAIFGSGNAFSVPIAATLGLPLYINTEASLPLVRAMLDAGMNQGAALAFLITGAGTSFGAIAGMLTIARWRVICLVVGTLWAGAVLFGVAYNLMF